MIRSALLAALLPALVILAAVAGCPAEKAPPADAQSGAAAAPAEKDPEHPAPAPAAAPAAGEKPAAGW